MVLSALKKKVGRVYTSSLIAPVRALEQKEANTLKKSRRQEIIKLRPEINHIEMTTYIKNQKQTNKNKSGAGSMIKINDIDKSLTKLSRGHKDYFQINKNRNETVDITTEI